MDPHVLRVDLATMQSFCRWACRNESADSDVKLSLRFLEHSEDLFTLLFKELCFLSVSP